MPEARYVPGSNLTIERLPGSIHLRITVSDEFCVPNARIRKVFPLSVPNDYLSIQDAGGHEVAIITDAESLSPESKNLIAEALDRTYFTPAIAKIDLLRQEAGMWHFGVRTQRGPADFYVRNWRDSAHEIAPRRWQIMSVDGARFEILDLEQMDERSRRLLDQLL